MTMIRLAAAIVTALMLFAPLAHAQTDDEKERLALAERIVSRTWDDTKRTVEVIRDQIAATLPVEQRAQFRDQIDANFDFDRYRQLNIAIQARHFTAAELKALDAFYTSPEGQSIMRKMPLAMGEMSPYTQQMMVDAIK